MEVAFDWDGGKGAMDMITLSTTKYGISQTNTSVVFII